MPATHRSVLPNSLPPRGLPRVQAAEYVGISPTLFDEMVADGRMPKPTRIGRRCVWDRRQIDRALDALFYEPEHEVSVANAAPEFVL